MLFTQATGIYKAMFDPVSYWLLHVMVKACRAINALPKYKLVAPPQACCKITNGRRFYLVLQATLHWTVWHLSTVFSCFGNPQHTGDHSECCRPCVLDLYLQDVAVADATPPFFTFAYLISCSKA
jgi:hypothetical protein